MKANTLLLILCFNFIFTQKKNIKTNNDAKRRLVHRILNLAIEKAVYNKWNQKFEINKCLKFVDDQKCQEENPCDCPENKGKGDCIVKKCEQDIKVGNFDENSPCYVCKKDPVPEQYKEICDPIIQKCKDINVDELQNLDEKSLENFKKLCDKHKKDCQIKIESKTIEDADKDKCCNEKMKKLFPNFFKNFCKTPEICKDKSCKTCLERADDAEKANKELKDPQCLEELCIAGKLETVLKIGNDIIKEDCEEYHKDCEQREWETGKELCEKDCKKDFKKFLLDPKCKVDCTKQKYKDNRICKKEPLPPAEKCEHVYYLIKDIVTIAKEGTIDKDMVKKTLNKEFCEKDIFLTDMTEYEKKCSEIAISDLKIQGALSEEEFKSKISELKSKGFIQNGKALKKESKVNAKSLLA